MTVVMIPSRQTIGERIMINGRAKRIVAKTSPKSALSVNNTLKTGTKRATRYPNPTTPQIINKICMKVIPKVLFFIILASKSLFTIIYYSLLLLKKPSNVSSTSLGENTTS